MQKAIFLGVFAKKILSIALYISIEKYIAVTTVSPSKISAIKTPKTTVIITHNLAIIDLYSGFSAQNLILKPYKSCAGINRLTPRVKKSFISKVKVSDKTVNESAKKTSSPSMDEEGSL